MGKSIVAEGVCEKYLANLLETLQFAYGVIIGQPGINGKDYVVHLARTPDETFEDSSNVAADVSPPYITVVDVRNINETQIDCHAANAQEMLPSGFFVLGIFIVSRKNVFEDKEDLKKLKTIISTMAESQRANKLLSPLYDISDKLILLYSGGRNFTCKHFEINKNNNQEMYVKPAEWRFQQANQVINWQLIKTNFCTEETFPLIRMLENAEKYIVETNINNCTKIITENLTNSLVFVDGERFSGDDTIDTIIKAKQKCSNTDNLILHGSIYNRVSDNFPENEIVTEYDGIIKFSGTICSRIWLHPKMVQSDAQHYIINDILASLQQRINTFLDSYTATDEDISASTSPQYLLVEPPRRAFFAAKSIPIQFCDYLFRGEGADTIIKQAKDILDIVVDEKDVKMDVENLSDSDFVDGVIDENPEKLPDQVNTKSKQTMYLMGITVALIVLWVSILLHAYM